MKRGISFLLFIFISSCCCAQTAGYKHSADLGKIEKSGFYNIALTPEITAHLKTDQSDIRIVDSTGKWIPHLIQTPAYIVVRDAIFMDQKYTITENTSAGTTIIVQQTDTASNLIIKIKNSTERRFFDLSGSDDQKSWSVINDSILPEPAEPETKTTSSLMVHFSAVYYKFIRIYIHNNNKDPFGIINISTKTVWKDFVKSQNDRKIVDNPAGIITQKDSGKVSYVIVSYPDSYFFTEMHIAVSSPKYFSRDAGLYIRDTEHPNIFPGKLIQSFTLSNNSSMDFRFSAVKADTFYIRIDNADNPPIQVSAVKTAYNFMYLTTYLEQGKSYRLFFDNTTAQKPDYDLSRLTEQELHDSMPFLSPQNFRINEKETEKLSSEEKHNKLLLWSAIILILCLLLFFTSKMLRETNKRNDDHL